MWQAIKCMVGRHRWSYVKGTQKPTGFAIKCGIVAEHELQSVEECECCALRRTRFGLVPTNLDRQFIPLHYRTDRLWPIDKDGKQLPLRDPPKPIYHTIDSLNERLNGSV